VSASNSLSPDALARLKGLAEDAKRIPEPFEPMIRAKRRAAVYAKAASPDVVLALIAEIERLRMALQHTALLVAELDPGAIPKEVQLLSIAGVLLKALEDPATCTSKADSAH